MGLHRRIVNHFGHGNGDEGDAQRPISRPDDDDGRSQAKQQHRPHHDRTPAVPLRQRAKHRAKKAGKVADGDELVDGRQFHPQPAPQRRGKGVDHAQAGVQQQPGKRDDRQLDRKGGCFLRSHVGSVAERDAGSQKMGTAVWQMLNGRSSFNSKGHKSIIKRDVKRDRIHDKTCKLTRQCDFLNIVQQWFGKHNRVRF